MLYTDESSDSGVNLALIQCGASIKDLVQVELHICEDNQYTLDSLLRPLKQNMTTWIRPESQNTQSLKDLTGYVSSLQQYYENVNSFPAWRTS